MKKLELIFTGLIFLGFIIRFTPIPGGSLTYTIGFLMLALLYYSLGFVYFNDIPIKKIFKKESYKGISVLRIIGAVGLGISLATVLIGILLLIHELPNGQQNLIIGLIFTGIVALISIYKLFKTKDKFYKKALKRIGFIGVPGVIILLLTIY